MAEQNYGNHAYRATAWLVAWGGTALLILLFLWMVYQERSVLSLGLLLLGFLLLLTISILRTFALRLQDRIIRLEMRVRLGRLGREEIVERLTVKQLVALRFASDGEVVALANRAVSEHLSPDQIKRAVTNWQADTLRT
jgi:hypothetical protein